MLLQRILPTFVLLLICGGIYGAMSGNSETVSKSASSAKVSSSSSNENEKKSSSSKDESSSESEDSESSDNEDNSSDNSSSDSNDDYNNDDKDGSTAASDDNNDTDTTKGDMETDQQGTIVGNSHTMVYHTPDQQGYRMNSANAVYFNTEAEAQAAGYRKSAR